MLDVCVEFFLAFRVWRVRYGYEHVLNVEWETKSKLVEPKIFCLFGMKFHVASSADLVRVSQAHWSCGIRQTWIQSWSHASSWTTARRMCVQWRSAQTVPF